MQSKFANMDRANLQAIQDDVKDRLVLLIGPRQVGKTHLSKTLYKNHEYLNFDFLEDKLKITKKLWKRDVDLLILDELHKLKNWKAFLKGLYDIEKNSPPILVTGSARLDASRKMGDSLAGRFFQYRLLPFSVHEVKSQIPPNVAIQRFMKHGGFPEPFLKDNTSFTNKWRNSHIDIILRQDLIYFEIIKDLSSMELMIEMLKERVGSTLSYLSLARDLQKDSATIKRWIQIVENLFLIFKVTPYHKNLARSVLKEPKIYFYDTSIPQKESAKWENVVALHLLKAGYEFEDLGLGKFSLHYLKTKDQKEIDFLVLLNGKPSFMVEAKLNGKDISPNFRLFQKFFPKLKGFQISLENIREYDSPEKISVRNGANFLAGIDSKFYFKQLKSSAILLVD